MANSEYLSLLNQGVEVWNQWRAKHPEIVSPDLSGASLVKLNLIEADLTGADLQGADFKGADLFGADFFSARLGEADLSTANGVTPEQIGRALGNRITKLPEDFPTPEHWLPEPKENH